MHLLHTLVYNNAYVCLFVCLFVCFFPGCFVIITVWFGSLGSSWSTWTCRTSWHSRDDRTPRTKGTSLSCMYHHWHIHVYTYTMLRVQIYEVTLNTSLLKARHTHTHTQGDFSGDFLGDFLGDFCFSGDSSQFVGLCVQITLRMMALGLVIFYSEQQQKSRQKDERDLPIRCLEVAPCVCQPSVLASPPIVMTLSMGNVSIIEEHLFFPIGSSWISRRPR